MISYFSGRSLLLASDDEEGFSLRSWKMVFYLHQNASV